MDFKYVTNVVISTVLNSVEEVEEMHAALKRSNQYELKKFEYQSKDVKEKKEIVYSYFLVKATLGFNNEKEPESHISINFTEDYGDFPTVINNDSDDEEE